MWVSWDYVQRQGKKWTCTNLKGDCWVNTTVCVLFTHSCSQCASRLKYVTRKSIGCANIMQRQVTVSSWRSASERASALTRGPRLPDERCTLIKREADAKSEQLSHGKTDHNRAPLCPLRFGLESLQTEEQRCPGSDLLQSRESETRKLLEGTEGAANGHPAARPSAASGRTPLSVSSRNLAGQKTL